MIYVNRLFILMEKYEYNKLMEKYGYDIDFLSEELEEMIKYHVKNENKNKNKK